MKASERRRLADLERRVADLEDRKVDLEPLPVRPKVAKKAAKKKAARA